MADKRPMFVGPIGCGKTSIIQRLTNQSFKYNKTQSIEFVGGFIDTPGEYIEHRRMYTHIATTAMDASIVILILSVLENRLILPDGFTTMFACPVIGVVNKMDLVDYDESNPRFYETAKQLNDAGVKTIVSLSARSGKNIDQLVDEIKKTRA